MTRTLRGRVPKPPCRQPHFVSCREIPFAPPNSQEVRFEDIASDLLEPRLWPVSFCGQVAQGERWRVSQRIWDSSARLEVNSRAWQSSIAWQLHRYVRPSFALIGVKASTFKPAKRVRWGTMRNLSDYRTLPANLCPFSGRRERARFSEDFGEAVGETVKAKARIAVW